MVESASARQRAWRLLGWLVLALWLGFAGLTWYVASLDGQVSARETQVALTLHDVAVEQPWLVGLGRALDVIGSVPVCAVVVAVTAVALVIGGALRRPFGSRTFGLALIVTSAVSAALIATYVKSAIDRPRPPWNGLWVLEESASYPSGHAQSGISVWVALGVVALAVLGSRGGWGVAAPLFVLGPLIGLSRGLLGVHWPLDVLGGWLLGAACLGTSVLLFRRWLASGEGAARSRR